MKIYYLPLQALFLLALAIASANAQDGISVIVKTSNQNEQKAKKLIQQMEDMYRSTASRATMTLRIETPSYHRTMTMESFTQGENKMLIRILSPKKERGIATLKLGKEMWNFFPKINKTIKVPPSMMMGSWMGSDFTNDDLVKETTLIEEYSLMMTESERNYRVILTPKAQTVTVWGRIDVKISKQTHLPVEQSFFDDSGRKVRSMLYTEPKQFGDVTLPSMMEMRPLNKKGHRTLVIYDSLELNAKGIEENQFSLRALKKRLR